MTEQEQVKQNEIAEKNLLSDLDAAFPEVETVDLRGVKVELAPPEYKDSLMAHKRFVGARSGRKYPMSGTDDYDALSDAEQVKADIEELEYTWRFILDVVKLCAVDKTFSEIKDEKLMEVIKRTGGMRTSPLVRGSLMLCGFNDIAGFLTRGDDPFFSRRFISGR